VSPLLHNFSTRLLFLLSFFTHRGVVFWGRRRGQEVGRAERAERELATGAADLLSAGHSPHLLACVQAFSFQLSSAAGRPYWRLAAPTLGLPAEPVHLPQYSIVGTVGEQTHSLFME
jgi:hypothetical protein